MSGWMRLTNNIGRHPKHLRVDPAASWLWACGIGYCRDSLTDGFIPASALPLLGNFRRPADLARQLVQAALWKPVEGGWLVNDYHDMNLPKSEVRERQEQDAVRKKDERASKRTLESIRSDAHQPSAHISRSRSISLQIPPSMSEEGSGETGRAERFWERWRALMSEVRQTLVPISPKSADLPKILEAIDAVPDEADLFGRLERFIRLSSDQAKALNVKAVTVGYFVMALPQLVAAAPPVTPCQHRHEPPCKSEIECSRRHMADLQKGVA